MSAVEVDRRLSTSSDEEVLRFILATFTLDDVVKAVRTLASVKWYCAMSRESMSVPVAETASEVLAIIDGGLS